MVVLSMETKRRQYKASVKTLCGEHPVFIDPRTPVLTAADFMAAAYRCFDTAAAWARMGATAKETAAMREGDGYMDQALNLQP
jgi:hypothetical protein